MGSDQPPSPPAHRVAFREAAGFWVKLGFINVGGPTGQIAIMHEELVDRRRWIGEERFLHALSYCMLLPGPEAQQLATYVGWLLHGVPGGLLAGITFVLPGFVLMMGLAYAYAVHGDVPWIAGVFGGLSAVVVGIVLAAMIRLAGRALGRPLSTAVAVLAFLAIFAAGVPFPSVIASAAAIGFAAGATRPQLLAVGGEAETPEPDGTLGVAEPRGRLATLRVLLTGLLAWWGPLVVAAWVLGPPVFDDAAIFFSQLAVVTFGGAYAVLTYLAQQAAERFGLMTADVVAGLGLAESTPGPLIMVVQFVGFLAAFRNPGSLDPVIAGVLGATIATWATFAPSFLWIFLGAPSIERLRRRVRIRAALSAITSAVVGVIASLALTFAATVLFDESTAVAPLGHAIPVPVPASTDVWSLAIAAASFVGLWRFRLNVLWVVALGIVAGLARAALR